MEKLRTKLVNTMLRHDGLVAVPESWQTEYVKLAGDKVRNGQAIAELIKEYNDLLNDYLDKCSIKELKEMAKNGEIKLPKDADKNTIKDLVYNDYKMRKEK